MEKSEATNLQIQHLRTITKTVRKILADNFDYEDIAVGIFIECLEKGVMPSHTVVKRRCLDALRKRYNEVAYREGLPEPLTSRDEGLQAIDNIDQIERLMAGLTNSERMIVFYRFFIGDSVKEIAEIVKLPVSIVYQRLREALYKMRQEAWR